MDIFPNSATARLTGSFYISGCMHVPSTYMYVLNCLIIRATRYRNIHTFSRTHSRYNIRLRLRLIHRNCALITVDMVCFLLLSFLPPFTFTVSVKYSRQSITLSFYSFINHTLSLYHSINLYLIIYNMEDNKVVRYKYKHKYDKYDKWDRMFANQSLSPARDKLPFRD